jgi:hypothetical protein
MFQKIKTAATAATLGAVSFVAAPSAFAGEMADAVISGMDKTELSLIGAAVLALVGIVVLIRKSGKAAGG